MFATVPGRIITGAGADGIGACTGAGARFAAVAAIESFDVVWATLGAKIGRKARVPGGNCGVTFCTGTVGGTRHTGG